MSKVIPVVFTFDKRIVLGASVAIKSLLDNAKNDTVYDIRILHSDLPLSYQKEFASMVRNTRHSMAFHYIDKSIFKGVKKNHKSWTEIVYYRMIISEILPEYDKAIYSDVDVFFKGDMSEIYSTDIKDFEIGAVRAEKNSKNMVGHKYFPENKNQFIFWSGFLLLNLKKLRQEKFFSKFMKTAFEFKNRLKFFDLDVINLTCHNIKPLPFDYCVLEAIYTFSKLSESNDYKYISKVYSDKELLSAKKNPMIIHFAGQLGKPWRRKHPPEYYLEYMNAVPKKLRHFTLRDRRKKLFNKN